MEVVRAGCDVVMHARLKLGGRTRRVVGAYVLDVAEDAAAIGRA